MPRGTRRIQVARQQQHILLLALFLLKHEQKRRYPEKDDVVRFIAARNLIAISAGDREAVSTGEERWANRIAFCRADLKKDGLLAMPKRGIWQITEAGELRLLEWAVILHYFATVNENWEDRLEGFASVFGEEKIDITNDTIRAAGEAYRIAEELFPERIPAVSNEVKGKIRL